MATVRVMLEDSCCSMGEYAAGHAPCSDRRQIQSSSRVRMSMDRHYYSHSLAAVRALFCTTCHLGNLQRFPMQAYHTITRASSRHISRGYMVWPLCRPRSCGGALRPPARPAVAAMQEAPAGTRQAVADLIRLSVHRNTRDCRLYCRPIGCSRSAGLHRWRSSCCSQAGSVVQTDAERNAPVESAQE